MFVLNLCYSQSPPNLLGKEAKAIDSIMKSMGAHLKEKTYTSNGYPILTYEFDYSLQKQKNSFGSAVYIAFFVMAIEKKCSTCTYIYGNKVELNSIVDQMDEDVNYTKKKDSFGWENNHYNFDMNIKQEESLFSLDYVWVKGVRAKK